MTDLRFACSNIAWSDQDASEALALLRENGVSGIEVAPTRIWPDWQGASLASARRWAAQFADMGFCVPSIQALLFGKPDAQLFGADGGRAFEAHLRDLAPLGGALGARAAVLGAPRNRQRGNMPSDAAEAHACDVFRRLAVVYADAGMVLALEPARPEYGGDFITTTADALRMAERVDHPGLGVHLDAAALHSAGERLADIWDLSRGRHLAHYQLSEPDLGGFETPVAPHLDNLAFLQRVAWQGWCAIEMRAQPQGLKQSGPWGLLAAARRAACMG
ncbi:MAG: sugar phosphate isomerase/epimerase [Proteobacteria bacterium]|uniref:sugar phosphate isomerase/epimerase family protein n=1 Tax=Aquabacterium sp. TaxID=1872578 RepID=UPI0035C74C28|nr:sugar phosphate isomerase/epimerase [Pseudomonadota bacterium]